MVVCSVNCEKKKSRWSKGSSMERSLIPIGAGSNPIREKKRQMIWTVVALAEQGAYREDWGNEELDEYLQTLYLYPIDYIYR